MNIKNIDELPEVASRARWASIIEVNQSTLWRAEHAGQLKGSKTKSGGIVYRRRDILEWLGINEPVDSNP